MIREKALSLIDYLAHKNQFVAKKVQGTLIDKVYHLLLDRLERK